MVWARKKCLFNGSVVTTRYPVAGHDRPDDLAPEDASVRPTPEQPRREESRLPHRKQLTSNSFLDSIASGAVTKS